MLESTNNIHLTRLFRLRNVAILGQIIFVLFTHNIIDIKLPLFELSIIIFHISLFNLYVWLRLGNKLTHKETSASENEVFFHLAFDVIILAMLLYFTGGATNPFVLLFLFPITITVTILPVRFAWLLAALSIICYSLLMFYYQPLPIEHNMQTHESTSEYDLHLIGMWIAFILNAGLITYYVYGMSNTLRRQQNQLNAAREQSIRDEQLVILGTLAASTAHELGTPLGTMALLVEEIEASIDKSNHSITADLLQLKKQISRCKTSLTDLAASVGASSDLFGAKEKIVCNYLEQIVSELQEIHPTANLNFHCSLENHATLFTDRTLSLSLINIIENAIEASPEYVAIQATQIDASLQLVIIDNGIGLSDKALDKIGQQPYSEKHLGLGLGLYLAYAAIRRRQGKIEQKNGFEQGSITTILLPLKK